MLKASKFVVNDFSFISTVNTNLDRKSQANGTQLNKQIITVRRSGCLSSIWSKTCSTLTTSGDAGRALIRDGIHRPQQEPAEFHRWCQVGSKRCVLPLSSMAILNFHQTFPKRYSWLDICPLFSLIIDLLFFGFSFPIFFCFKNSSIRISFSSASFLKVNPQQEHKHECEENIYRLRFESFCCFNAIKSAIISTSFLTFITIIYR